MQIPDSAPFSPSQRQAIQAAITGFSPLQAGWLSGFLANFGAAESTQNVRTTTAPAAFKVTVLYGTESGNSETLAAENVKKLKARGYQATLLNMADTSPTALQAVENLLVVVSTWGDGEPPDAATGFLAALMAEDAPKLSRTRFSVCALGDTSYEKFCECGKQIDRRLEELGANRLVARVDCDLDYEEPHATWFSQSLAALDSLRAASSSAASAVAEVTAPASTTLPFGKKNPFPSPLLRKFLLNGKGSQKETWHLEFSLENSGMTYQPGDALGLVPHNAPDVVESVLRASGLSESDKISLKDQGEVTLGEAFSSQLDITGLTSVVLGKYNALAQSSKLAALLEPDHAAELNAYLHGRHVVDLLEEFPIPGLTAQSLAGLLRKLPPRLYSIASSLKAHPDEVHLTVAAVRYEAHGKKRKGVASTFVADLLEIGQTSGVYVHANKNFKLPDSGDTPIIMVGPGTGIAPFRSFIEERSANGDKGKSWLFFGDQHYTYDFLYQLEWQDYLKSGVLSRLDVAFSRDQKEKIYVQNRMRQRARELWAWLEEGAHFYVCGDASRMAHDVHETLIQIAMTEGGLTHDAATARIEDLKKSKRYQRDVY